MESDSLTTPVRPAQTPRLVCLMYHRLIGTDEGDTIDGTERIFSIPVARFESQLRALQAAGWSFVSLQEAIEIIRGGRQLTGPSILVSFDDGCRSIHSRALPVLEALGVPAVVFVTTDDTSPVFSPVGRRDPRLTDEQIRDLIARGIAIGSHGVSHSPLAGLDEEQIRRELTGSRARLESICGVPITALAIPGNWYDARVISIARETGYTSIWTSDPGFLSRSSSLWRLPRVNVEGTCTPDELVASLRLWTVRARRAAMELKKLPKRAFGPRRWMAIRKRIYSRIPARFASTSRIVRYLWLAGTIAIAGSTLALLIRALG